MSNLIKIVLIDDEPFHLIGMRTVIPWEECGFAIVGEARNGADGIELIRRERPDIAMVDVVMPGMDGLEMIRRLRGMQLPTKYIVLSCMNDIQCYKDSLKLGVSEYLQKDLMTPELLLEAVERVSKELQQEQGREEAAHGSIAGDAAMRTVFLNQVLTGQVTDPETIARRLREWNLLEYGAAFVMAAISVQSLGPSENEDLLEYSVISICEEIACHEGACCFFRTAERTLAALLPVYPKAHMQRIFDRMKNTVEQTLDCVLTMGLSHPERDVKKLSQVFEEACRAEECGYLYGLGVLYEPLLPECKDAESKHIPINVKRIKVFSGEALHQGLDDLVEQLRGNNVSKKCAQAQMVALTHFILLLAEQTGTITSVGEIDFEKVLDSCQRAATLEAAAGEIGKLIDAIDDRCASNQNGELIMKIKQYVAEHLHAKINLNDIAQSVYLSPPYVSRVFKQETGVNLSTYIRIQKIEEAKKLLITKQVGEVSDLLGYNSVSHFVAIFNEQTNSTPYQYKKRIMKNQKTL